MNKEDIEKWAMAGVTDKQEINYFADDVKEIFDADDDDCAEADDESSFNDDEVPTSEEDLMSTIVVLADAEDYIPPITRNRRTLLAYIAANQPNVDDDKTTELIKTKKRLIAVNEFRNYLKKRRQIKEFKRLRKVKEMNLQSPSKEAFVLEKQELADKKLNRPFYHEETEPDCFKTLLAKRRQAIKRKYELYAMDPSYRKEMEQKLVNFMNVLNRQLDEAENLANKTLDLEDELDDHIGDTDDKNIAGRARAEDSETEESSFYDLEIPQSERDFFSSDLENDPMMGTEPESNNLDLYFYFLNKCRPEPGDDSADTLMKFLKEVEVKAQFKNFLFNKRALKAIARFKTIEEMNLLDPEAEARILLDLEIKDKKLDKSYYYTPDEPDYYKKVLEKRRNAIQKKYEAYAECSDIREKMRVDAHVDVMRMQPAPLFETAGIYKQNTDDTEEDASSFNDSEIPTSEEDFASDTKITYPEYFIKPHTRTRQALYDELDMYEIDNLKDSQNLINKKRKARLRVIQRYKMRLRDRRRRRAIERLQTVNSLGITDVIVRARRLRKLELIDKKLNRNFLYLPGEPDAFKQLLAKRIRAINRKYEAYATNKHFQDEMEQRILSGMEKRKQIIDEYDDETEEYDEYGDEGDIIDDVDNATLYDDWDDYSTWCPWEGSLPVQDGKAARKRELATKGVWPMRRDSAPPVIHRGMCDDNLSMHYGSASESDSGANIEYEKYLFENRC